MLYQEMVKTWSCPRGPPPGALGNMSWWGAPQPMAEGLWGCEGSSNPTIDMLKAGELQAGEVGLQAHVLLVSLQIHPAPSLP